LSSLPCKVEGCKRLYLAKNLCHLHYYRLKNSGDYGPLESKKLHRIPAGAICKIDQCDKPVKTKNLCDTHYRKLIRHGNPLWQKAKPRACKIAECLGKHSGLGFCKFHYNQFYQLQNPGKSAGNQAKRRAQNPEKFKGYYNTYRARKMNGANLFTPKDLKRLYASPCAYCGAIKNLELDHIVPLSRGGKHSIGNTTTACRSCNASKSDRLLMEWRLNKPSPRYSKNH
jgi:5-methylcytosine-specific restriction endonuclease McrA